MMLPKSCQKAAAKPADAKTAAFLTVHAKRVVIPARSAILLTKARTKSAWKAVSHFRAAYRTLLFCIRGKSGRRTAFFSHPDQSVGFGIAPNQLALAGCYRQ